MGWLLGASLVLLPIPFRLLEKRTVPQGCLFLMIWDLVHFVGVIDAGQRTMMLPVHYKTWYERVHIPRWDLCEDPPFTKPHPSGELFCADGDVRRRDSLWERAWIHWRSVGKVRGSTRLREPRHMGESPQGGIFCQHR